jgi:hypothetical protein
MRRRLRREKDCDVKKNEKIRKRKMRKKGARKREG